MGLREYWPTVIFFPYRNIECLQILFLKKIFHAYQGNLNLITQALEAVGRKMGVIPDPTTVHFHLPDDLSVQVCRDYNDFVEELSSKFPHEKEGIKKFYNECWKVCVIC